MRDAYQTSMRNFGKSTPPRRAPVDDVDARVAAAVEQIATLSIAMCEMSDEDRAVGMEQMIALTTQKSALLVERDTIIREFFYGKRV